MAETHVLSALTAKRAELSGEIKKYQSEIERLETELDHIDGAIKIFDPDYDLRGIRPRLKRDKDTLFAQNELNRLILDVMRAAGAPISIRSIFDDIIKRKEISLESIDSKAIQKSMGKILLKYEKNATVKKSGVDELTSANMWEIC